MREKPLTFYIARIRTQEGVYSTKQTAPSRQLSAMDVTLKEQLHITLDFRQIP